MKFLLVSDLDDTIKISNTEKKLVTVYRGLFRVSAFAGMPELYQELTKNAHDTSAETCLHIISSSPPAIRRRIEKFLKQNKFPIANLTLRDWFKEKSIPKYKLSALEKLATSTTPPLLLIGDDTEHDPEIFEAFMASYPDRVLASYVRAVRGRTLPKGMHRFYTAFDIACSELAANRLNQEQVLLIGNAVLAAQKNSRLIPPFMKAPPLDFIPFLHQLSAVDEKLFSLWEKIRNKINLMQRKKN